MGAAPKRSPALVLGLVIAALPWGCQAPATSDAEQVARIRATRERTRHAMREASQADYVLYFNSWESMELEARGREGHIIENKAGLLEVLKKVRGHSIVVVFQKTAHWDQGLMEDLTRIFMKAKFQVIDFQESLAVGRFMIE